MVSDETNRKSIEAIQTSLFLLCLDGPASNLNAPNVATLAALKIVHGGGSRVSSGNRWFDKTVEVRKCFYCPKLLVSGAEGIRICKTNDVSFRFFLLWIYFSCIGSTVHVFNTFACVGLKIDNA